MLTPQEIQEKKFEKSAFGGYNMGQVDVFLDEVLSDYTALYKDNATLKAKMRVLVDKIEEYRAVDEEMRKTLYTAQVTAKEMIDRAKMSADSLLSNARREADQKIARMELEVLAEQRRLEEAQNTSASYIAKIKEAMRRNIELMDSIQDMPQEELRKKGQPPKDRPAPRDDFEVVLPEEAAPEPAEAPEPAGEGPSEWSREAREPARVGGQGAADFSEMETQFFEIELGAGKAAAAAEPEEGDTAKIYGDAPFTPKPKFDFSDMRFGKDYDAGRDEE